MKIVIFPWEKKCSRDVIEKRIVGCYSKGTLIILQSGAYNCLFWAFSMDNRGDQED